MTVVGKQIKTKRIETEILEMPWWENIVRKPVRQTCPYVNKKKQSIHIQLAWLYITFGTDINGIYDPPKAYHVFESTCNWEGKFSSTVGKIVFKL